MAVEKRIGDWHRRNGDILILAHPGSPWGQRREEVERNGWRYIGTTRLGIDDPRHPGLDAYEDVSFVGRWRRFWGTGKDEIRKRALA